MIKTLLLDLGNVLLPLDISATYKAFEALGAKKTLDKDLDFFHEWERGNIDTHAFEQNLRNHISYSVHANSLHDAWNAMLLPMPAENIRLLKSLKKKYNLVLISNINKIHEEAIKRLMGPFAYAEFLDQFSAVYYSHQVGMRKPDAVFFEHVIKESALIAEETLFVDDTEDNINFANKLGFKTWRLNPEKELFTAILNRLKKLNAQKTS